MDKRLAGRILGTTVLAAAITLEISAQPRAPQPEPGAVAAPIRLRSGTFTPARGERLTVPDALSPREIAAGRRGYYIVQFDGPVEDEWKAAIVAAGAEILGYIPEFALKVRINPGDAAQLSGVPHVAWVGVFEPAYRLASPIFPGNQLRPYIVRLERGVNAAAAEGEIRSTGARVVRRQGPMVIVAASESQIQAVAHVADVATIEAFMLRRKHNEFGGSVMRADVAAAAGYDGSTQTIAISDTGLGGGTPASSHRDLGNRVLQVFNWPGASDFCFETVTPDGPIDVDTGHGTHVATSALGGGDSNGAGRGTAPASRLVFQAIEDYVVPSFFCQFLLGLTPGYYLAGIPADLGALFDQGYTAGARVHSLSWGSAANGGYTEDSAGVDAFVWGHRDLAVTISAGNSGVDTNGDGIVDGGSLNAPATAKNVITVGASEGDRSSNYECDAGSVAPCAANGGHNDVFSYGSAFGSAFPVNPLKDDPTAGNADQMAAFSSRGPTSDGRIKPDVVAPGTWILSGYSDNYQQFYDPSPNPQNGQYQYDGWGDPLNDKYKYMGGTSMSAPLVAGAAAVVRDYYEKAHAHAASAALVKATLVNSAVDLQDENNDGANDNAFPIPNVHEGWGRVDLGAATDGSREFADEVIALSTGGVSSQTLLVDGSLLPLRVTVAWTDAPSTTAAAKHLVNDLDLQLIAPDGTTYNGNGFVDGYAVPGTTPDRTNNLENVYIAAPAAGDWTIVVRGYNVPQGPQPFALVIGREANPVQQLPRVSVVASTSTVNETATTGAQFTLSRSGDLSSELTVAYMMSGAATAGADYQSLPGTATFAAGAADVVVAFTPVDDLIIEPNEPAVLTVSAGATYGVRAPASATITIVSDDQPGDLVVNTVTVPATAAAGAMIGVGDTTNNRGSFATQASETGFYLSTNSTWDAADTFLGTRPVPVLSAGAVHTQQTNLTIPATAAGTYYVIARADWNAVVAESNEFNNNRASTSIKIGPDLTVSALTIPTSAAPGGIIKVSDTTRNDGVQTAPASLTAFYLSTNTTLEASDPRLGSRPVPELAPGTAHQFEADVTIPTNTAAGSYYIIARADDALAITEAVETNNTRHAPSLRVGADLIVSAVSGPTVAAPGGTISVSDTTRNQGAGDAGPFKTAFYLSSNSTLSADDKRLGDRTLTSGLDEGLSSTANTTLTVPGTTAPGMYYLIANADDLKAVVEPVETNNTRVASAQIKVGPDLMVVSVGVPSIGGAGAEITITDNLRNAGGSPSTATEAVFYLSSNTALDAGDIEIARRPLAALNAGISEAGSVKAVIPGDTAVGSYYVIELVDADDAVEEANESNNSYRSGTIRIGPDLTFTALSAPGSAAAGTSINVTDTTKNSGGDAAAASMNRYYLSANTAIDAGDTVLGVRSVSALGAGAIDALTTAFTIPANQPPGTYYLIANANDSGAVEETSVANNTRRMLINITK
jgi:subtilase family serine protease/subtilisin family serine protease